MGPHALRITIGTLSERTGCNIETIRYYERIGVMPEPPRTQGGHRLYGEEHLKRLNFVCRSRALGFTLDQVRGLLCFVDRGDYTCADVKAMTLEHLEGVRRRIADLRRLEKVLKDMAAQCEGGKVPDCPMIEVLSRPAQLSL
ncbi:MAG: helix-turn-helix domain-containing protein [Acidiferrobacterales bacterium]